MASVSSTPLFVRAILTRHDVLVAEEECFELNSALGYEYEWLSVANNQYRTPAELENVVHEFQPAIVPGTVAQDIKQAIATLENSPENLNQLDQKDYWYRMTFSTTADNLTKTKLRFDGLLTYADIFLNGELILQSRNAYHGHVVDISDKLKPTNQLHLCFRAIAPFLTKKYARARFPTRLVSERHLRFLRTPVLGYAPGFTSPAKLVGPYRAIRLMTQKQYSVNTIFVDACLSTGASSLIGKVAIKVDLECLGQHVPTSGSLVLFDDVTAAEIKRSALHISQIDGSLKIETNLDADNISAYWPHTHGVPKRYLLKLELLANDAMTSITLGQYGFRSITRVDENLFALHINEAPVFLRGACWTPMNPMSLQVDVNKLHERLVLLRDAGVNMLRIPGNMLYESDDFYEMCDELGILIFQDFAFTNFDYPDTDAEFVESVTQEATTFLAKHGGRACLTVLAGNSEVAQQAVMMGLALGQTNAVFDEVLKRVSAQYAPNVPYVSSSPNSNTIPFHAGNGTSHYHGVGGYMRTYEDARLFKGKFIAECLAFSQVPENASLYAFFDNVLLPTHHPRWKDGVPRDVGSGWDFSDVTDFYIEQLFGINPVRLRAIEPHRYLDYCRATSAEVVERTMSILRADSAQGRAALVWFLHDLKPGAGWGYIDSLGLPKSAFYGLARASQATTLLFVDEGLEGLAIYIAHDGAESFVGQLEIALITKDGNILEQKTSTYHLASRSITRVSVDAHLERFVDSSYAYKFGARTFIACVAKLTQENGRLIAQKEYVEPILMQEYTNDLAMTAVARQLNEGCYELTISTEKPCFFASIDMVEFELSDNYFHVLPNFDKKIILKTKSQHKLNGRVRTFNSTQSTPITFEQSYFLTA